MIIRVDHIGIAVQNAPQAQAVFEKLLGKKQDKTEEVTSEGVETIFYNLDKTKLELLAATREDSVIRKFVEKRGEGMHHLALEVDDIAQEIQRLKAEGFAFINETPKPGADHKLICFLHPKSTCGVLVELCQDIGEGAEFPGYIITEPEVLR